MSFRLGNLELASNLFLSPLAGYTNLPFRLVIREIGGVGLCTTDLVNARSLLERNRKAHKLIETCPADHPLAVQLYGTVPEEMRDAALLLESLGVNSVDVNMGCPVRKVCRIGGGSALMNDHAGTTQMVKAMIDAVKIPVTCKMRLGWDDDNLTAPDLARALADIGVAGIVVHGRTRQQGFTGSVNRAGIRAVVQAVPNLPVTGNGDITTVAAAQRMFEETGCAAISIGRGAFYNPWIFRQIAASVGRAAPSAPSFEEREPTLDERLAVMARHLDRMVEVFGESIGCRMFRKVALEYATRFGPSAEFKRRIVRLSTRSEFEEVVAAYRQWRAQFLDENHRLRPQYEPRSLEAVSTIATPKGPNELW
jgi:tRNA-dihydrouridine synthase B